MTRTSRRLILLLAVTFGLCGRSMASSTATITVNGAEQSGDSNTITVAFNGFTETVHYGQYSSSASVASALAATFSRDYLQAGLCAAVTSPGGSTINFKLRGGAAFGTLNVTGATTSFTVSESGFTSQGSSTSPDTGTVTLTVFNSGGTVFSKSTNYGDGATPSSVAEGLAGSDGNVTVSAVSDTLFLQATGAGASTDYGYSVSAVSNMRLNPPSFQGSPSSGALAGGDNSGGSSQTTYQYNASYDLVGNVTSFSDDSSNGPIMGTWSMANSSGSGFCMVQNSGYDCLNRLVAAQATSGPYQGLQATWSYDSFGNRTSENFSGSMLGNMPVPPSDTTNYDANNQVSSTSLLGGGAPGYDAAGNVIRDNQNQYIYDPEGRICAVKNMLGGMTGYLYDAEGNRIAKGSITTWGSCDPAVNGLQLTNAYVLGQSGGQMSEYAMDVDGSMKWQHTNVWAADGLIATYDPNGLHFYLDDPVGSRRVQTDYAGNIEETCQNLPSGNGETCIPLPTEYLFTQHERDAESGNDYFGARYYASGTGRFLTPDPSGLAFADGSDPQSLNLYAYARNNPLAFTDPSGLQAEPTATEGWLRALWHGFENLFGGGSSSTAQPASTNDSSEFPGTLVPSGPIGDPGMESVTASAFISMAGDIGSIEAFSHLVPNTRASFPPPPGVARAPHVVDPRRQPDGSYKADTGPGSEIYRRLHGQMTNNPIGPNGECVDACRYFSGAPKSTLWSPGRHAMELNDTTDLGLAIATFDSSGHYPGDTDPLGKNSGIYMGHSPFGGIMMVDQWPPPENPPNTNAPFLHPVRYYPPDNMTHPLRSNNADAYYVILAP
jgi:RHS repeat-associated protein